MYDIIVIGAGASGLMAAYAAAEAGSRVLVLEKNEKIGKKLFITGKGRCNVTNASSREVIFSSILRNPKFLMSGYSRFDNSDLMTLIESAGVKLKTERGNRVFPVSDKSSDIIKALTRIVSGAGASVRLASKVRNIRKNGDVFTVFAENDEYDAKAVIVAAGGKSYPSTGSAGDGYRFAEYFGHDITDIRPALVPLVSTDGVCPDLQGVSLKNVKLTLTQDGHEKYSGLGEMLFTHFGLSGPLVLSASSRIDFTDMTDTFCHIDLKPALDRETLDRRILRDLEKYSNRHMENAMCDLLIGRLILPVLERAGIDPAQPANGCTREQRKKLIASLKDFRIRITGTRGFDEAIITRGGVKIKNVNPKTMESRLVPGLYFCGELLDLDAETGGFNLQIAFTTGYVAGCSAAGC